MVIIKKFIQGWKGMTISQVTGTRSARAPNDKPADTMPSRGNRAGHKRQLGANTVAERLGGRLPCRLDGQMRRLFGECRLNAMESAPSTLWPRAAVAGIGS